MSRRGTLVSVLLILVAWQLLAMALRRDILPPPLGVLTAFAEELPRGLGLHIAVSTARVVVSIVVSVLAAVPLGLIIGQSKRLNRLTAPLVYLTYPIPKIVFLPIVILFLGIGDASKIFIIAFILFYQILVVVRDQAATIRPELIHSVRSLGAGRVKILRYVYVPACTPAVLTALRVSAGTAIAVLFFAETFATTEGLGYYIIVQTWSRVAYAEMYAGVVAMSLLGLALYVVVDKLERQLCPWLFVT